MEKRFKTGLVLGKFYPPHRGHFYLIDTALSYCDKVFVMVCSMESESIRGVLRADAVRAYYKNNSAVEVIHIHRDMPQTPAECSSVDEFYNEYWVKEVYQHITQLDALFTSESYGDEFAHYLDVVHILVDQSRTTFPVSGTAVRNDPYGNWHMLTEETRDMFRKKVVVVGPESTGKSTLIKLLSQHFNTEYVDEFGRWYTSITGTNNLTMADFEVITICHYMNVCSERYKKKDDTKLLFVDTEAITTKLFAQLYLGRSDSDIIDSYIDKQRFDLWLLLDVDAPWVDDGTRDFPERREEHFKLIKDTLDTKGISYTFISGNYEQRLARAITEVNKLNIESWVETI